MQHITWTSATVLAAIDAGIPEVIRLFNRAYASAWRNGVELRGPRRELVPFFSASGAYTLAMESTIAQLQFIEAGTYISLSDIVRADDLAVALFGDESVFATDPTGTEDYYALVAKGL